MSERGGAPSFGDVTGEYLALRREAAVVTDWHELVWVRGPDAVSFLDGLVSQAVAAVPVGAVARSLLLGPQGKLRAPHHLLVGDGEIGLLVDAGVGEHAAADLRRFKIRVDVSIEVEPRPVVDLWGPAAPAAAAAALGAEIHGGGWVRGEGDRLGAAVAFRSAGVPRAVVVGSTPDELIAAGLRRAGRMAADAVRIEAGEPIMGVDVDDATIPQEAGLVEGAVDFAKGCYLGQELVARIDSRGHVNRHLRGVVLHVNVLPPLGAELALDGKAVGSLTSLAESLELRAPVGLALVRREVEPGSAVVIRWDGGEAAASVRELPLLDA